MQELDNIFFEEYKRLDNICKDMFLSSNGVSEYITQMELSAHLGRIRVQGWDEDYKMLKHLRWVRNQIAHNSGSFSTEKDLADLRSFYNRIFNLQDPLAVLRKYLELEKQKPKKVTNYSRPAPSQPTINTPKVNNNNYDILKTILIVFGIVFGVIIFVAIVSFILFS